MSEISGPAYFARARYRIDMNAPRGEVRRSVLSSFIAFIRAQDLYPIGHPSYETVKDEARVKVRVGRLLTHATCIDFSSDIRLGWDMPTPSAVQRKDPPKKKAPKKEPVGKCVECGRPFRPYGALAADYPGTVAHRTGGRCSACHHAYKKTKLATTRKCVGCGRPLRERGLSKTDAPGALLEYASGWCATCYRKQNAARKASRAQISQAQSLGSSKTLVSPYQCGICDQCGIPIRQPGIPADIAPGTKPYGTPTQCADCKEGRRK